MFVGTFEHSLDDKGRMVLPAAYRPRLAGGGYVAKLDACLGIWSTEDFAAVLARMDERVKAGAVERSVARSFAADAHEFAPDGQGRVVIPQRLRDFAGLSGDVDVNGAIDHLEIWDRDRWAEERQAGDEQIAAAGYDLAKLGI